MKKNVATVFMSFLLFLLFSLSGIISCSNMIEIGLYNDDFEQEQEQEPEGEINDNLLSSIEITSNVEITSNFDGNFISTPLGVDEIELYASVVDKNGDDISAAYSLNWVQGNQFLGAGKMLKTAPGRGKKTFVLQVKNADGTVVGEKSVQFHVAGRFIEDFTSVQYLDYMNSSQNGSRARVDTENGEVTLTYYAKYNVISNFNDGSIALANDISASGNYAYVANGDQKILRVDISNPGSMKYSAATWTETWAGMANYIKLSGDYAYVSNWEKGLGIVKLSSFKESNEGFFGLNASFQDFAIRDNRAYIACLDAGIQVIDISNPEEPSDPGLFYSTAWGGTSGNAYSVAVHEGYAYAADSNNGLVVIDLGKSSAENPQGAYHTGTGSKGEAVQGFAYRVTISGKYAYVSDWNEGIVIFDISTPGSPVRVSSYYTGFKSNRTVLSGNYLYIANQKSGLIVVDVSNPAWPVEAGICKTGPAAGIAIKDGVAYLARLSNGITAVNLRDEEGTMKPYEYAVNPGQIVQSKSILGSSSQALIKRVRLSTKSLALSGNILIMMSNNGVDWRTIRKEGIFEFDTRPAAGALYWSAVMATNNKFQSPVLKEVQIEYWEE
ncbi:MAG: hypothetical protein GY754_14480 [bacterium]|nr:hypothetical protein [bacterium]